MHRRHLIISLLAAILTLGFLSTESCRKVDEDEKEQKTTTDSLIGRWYNQQIYGQTTVDYYLTFKKGGKATEQYVFTEGNSREVVSCQGTYAVKKENIEFTWDKNSLKFTFNDAAQKIPARQREELMANQKAHHVEKLTNVILTLTKDRLVLGSAEQPNGTAISLTRK